MSANVRPVSDYVLEKYALGELPPERLAELAQRIKTEPDLAARLDALTSSNREILRKYPPAWFAAEVAAKTGGAAKRAPARSISPWRASLFALVPVASAAVLALWVLRPADDASRPIPGLEELSGTRIKGLQPSLSVYRKIHEEAERLDSTSVVQQGDVLQVSYVAAGQGHGVIVSVDGRGSITLHFPADGASTELRPEGETPIAHAYEIDDAPEFERFFLVTASSPIDVAAVIQAAESLARNPELARARPLALPDSLEQCAVLVQKKEVRQ